MAEIGRILVTDYTSVRIHPDTLLLLVLLLAQWALATAIRKQSQTALATSFILMTVGFMTKVVGLFMLPWIALAQVLLVKSSGEPLGRKLWSLAWRGALVFILVMYLTTPTLLVNSRVFFSGIASVSQDVYSGQVIDRESMTWPSIFLSTRLFGASAAIAFLIYVISWVPFGFQLCRSQTWAPGLIPRENLARLVPTLFAIAYLGYIFLFVKNCQVRYMMPVLPSVALCVGDGLVGGWAQLPRFQARWQTSAILRWASLSIILVGFLLESGTRIEASRTDTEWLTRQKSDPRLKVAKWLTANVPTDARIYYDYGVYVPYKLRCALRRVARSSD